MKKILSVLLLPLLLLSFISCATYGKDEKKDMDKKTILSKETEEIIRLASLAPSSHNAQMWKLKVINEKEFLVIWDDSRKLPASDPTNREAMISIGTFIENFVEAAKGYNLNTQVQIFDKLDSSNSVAKLILTEQKYENTATMIQNITERHSIKTPFKTTDIKENHLKELISLGNNINYFPLTSKKGVYIKESMYDASVEEAFNTATQEELSQWIVTSLKEDKERKDGMRAEQMGMEGIKKYFYYAFLNKNSVRSKSFINPGLKKSKEQVENCAGFAIITSKDNSIPELVNTGRTLERFLLKANELKVAVHTMSQILHEKPWKDEISSKLEVNGDVQMVLRIGYVDDYGKPNSLRRDIYDFIIQ